MTWIKGIQFRDPQCSLLRVLGLIKALSAPPAEVGPPSRVALSHEGKDVDVYIDDPVASSNTSMKKFLPSLFYHIRYWEGPSLAQVEALGPHFSLSVPPLKTPAATRDGSRTVCSLPPPRFYATASCLSLSVTEKSLSVMRMMKGSWI